MSVTNKREKIKRKIIKVDKDKCTGCGKCVVGCEEGALEIIDGKAEVVNESFCDGLGACIGECPEGALTIEKREAYPFDEELVEKLQNKEINKTYKGINSRFTCSCPSSQKIIYDAPWKDSENIDEIPSALRQWSIKIELVNPDSPYFRNKELLIVSDCSPLAYGDFHRKVLKGRPLVSICPMLDLNDTTLTKLQTIIENNPIEIIELVLMEVPCCKKITFLLDSIISNINKEITVKTTIISRDGRIK
ncbi:MAG: ATP-binding protein [Promethearchaeati archaeon]